MGNAIDWGTAESAGTVTPSYEDYTDAGYVTVAEADWPRYCQEAWDIADDVTYDRASEEVTLADDMHAAIFRIADAIAKETDISAETHGRHSVTYKARQTPHQVARAALSKTGLTYQGDLT